MKGKPLVAVARFSIEDVTDSSLSSTDMLSTEICIVVGKGEAELLSRLYPDQDVGKHPKNLNKQTVFLVGSNMYT